MSANPFRRSSLKGSSGTSNDVSPSIPIDIPADNGLHGSPLSVNTKAVTSSQKHVNFASPPAIPISPVSYPPSSPESSRISPAFLGSRPVLPNPTDYSEAIQSDPFQADAEHNEDDSAIMQALQNAKVNVDISALGTNRQQEDAVKNTLSKFASIPKRSTQAGLQALASPQTAAPARHTMDVDAFKRMLLTGDSGQLHTQSSSTASTSALGTLSTSETSSGTDTTSSSQRSTFDQGQGSANHSSSSSDISNQDVVEKVEPFSFSSEMGGGKKRPPPPKSRHGKAVRESPIPIVPLTHPSALSTPSEAWPPHNTPSSSDPPKQAPPPPVSRRRSQNNEAIRPNSTRQSPIGKSDIVSSQSDKDSRTPPPPPSRRPGSAIERRTSTDLAPTMEEPDSTNVATASNRRSSETRPPPPPARTSSSSKRMSLANMVAPPPPPPRRGRGSSRSSIDGQYSSIPAPANVGDTGSTRSSGEYARLDTGGQKNLLNPSTNDILADLAALQKEVDEARRLSGI